jgi:hypothetical protein
MWNEGRICFNIIYSSFILPDFAVDQFTCFSGRGKSFNLSFPFLKEKYRLVHSIENRMFGETQSVIIGVTLADPSTRVISCAIMTAEGMVLFEAESGPGTLKVNRALPPLIRQISRKI